MLSTFWNAVPYNYSSILRRSVFLGGESLSERTRACSNPHITAQRWIPFWSYKIHARSTGVLYVLERERERFSGIFWNYVFIHLQVKTRAMEIAVCIQKEDGVGAAVDAFHSHLPAEVPLPTPPSSEKDDGPNPLQWIFIQIGRLCSRPCAS